jgi:subtilisin family serine protease
MSPVRIMLLFFAVLVLLPLLVVVTRVRDQAQAVEPQEPSQNHAAAELRLVSALASVPLSELPKKGHPRLESSLVQLVNAFEHGDILKAASAAESAGIKLSGDTVRVIIEAQPGNTEEAESWAEALGGILEGSTATLVQALMPLSSLEELASHEAVRYVREPIRFLPLAVGSEGVSVSGVPAWRSAGLTGAGVKVAVVDFGFTGYGALLGTELPPQVVTRSFRWDGRMELPEEGNLGRHGTACAEIVYDMAPGAQLYLVSYETEVELAQAVDWLIAQGINVISFSIGGFWGRGDGTGPVNDIVAKAADAGVLWVNAAGNMAQQHWSGQWSDSTVEGVLDFAPGHPVNTLLAVEGDTMIVSLRWDDPFDASCNDYDLYILDPILLDYGLPLYSSTDFQNCSNHPIEQITFVAPYTGVYYVAVLESYSTRSPKFDLFFSPFWCLVDCPMLAYKTTSGSLQIPGDSARALTVGAVPWNSPNGIEDFSSQGPTTDGRIKPDLVAPDSVSTSSYGGYSLFNPGFQGTSASAPHVAGAAALVKQANPSFSPQQIRAYLEGRAVDLGSSGKDNVYGAGRLALGAAPSPTPTPTRTPTATPTRTATPSPTSGTTRTINLSPAGWHDLVWSGLDGTDPGTALACISGEYSIAYAWEGPTTGFKRYVENCAIPGICNMGPLKRYDSMLVLTSGDGTCQMPAAASVPVANRTVNLSPAGWHDLAWSGLDGTDPEAALSCLSGRYSIAYAWEGPTAGFKRYVEGCSLPGICNMGPLNRYDSMLVLTSADATCQMPVGVAATATATKTATPTRTATPIATPSVTATRTPTPTPTPVACPEPGLFSGIGQTTGGGDFGFEVVEDCGIIRVWSNNESAGCYDGTTAHPGFVDTAYDPALLIENGAFSGEGTECGPGPEGSWWCTTLQFTGQFTSDSVAEGELELQIDITGWEGEEDPIHCGDVVQWRATRE